MVPVKAPMVGTFYAQPEPGAPPYVAVGSHVDEDTTMGLVEVMKVFNAVRAGASGTVAEILVQNAQFVEFGQTLFFIKPDEPTADGASA
jgi:acetyl-CoA carboxylase biotin carboxyl carrier protein